MPEISKDLQSLIDAASSPSSKRALKSDLTVYSKWLGIDSISIPSTDVKVAEFIADMSKSRSVSTIIRYVSSISRAHDLANVENPTRSDLVRTALRGLRRSRGTGVSKSPALTGKQLIGILQTLPKSWAGQRNRAMFALGWSCGLRCSEMHAMDIGDVELVWEDGLSIQQQKETTPAAIITIRRSKTDQEGRGKKIGIPASPITSILARWIDMLIALYLTATGPLFPRFSYASVELYFPPKGLRPRMSVRGISKAIRTVLRANEIDGSVHSLRRGMITEAARLGVPEHIIQRHSRHASVSSLRGYIEDGNLFTDNPLPRVFDALFGCD